MPELPLSGRQDKETTTMKGGEQATKWSKS